MLHKQIHNNAGAPSFFYLLMAESCFRQAVHPCHPKAGGTLVEIGRNYLAKAKATGVTSVLESQPQLRRTAMR